MEDVHETALAYYNNAPKELQQLAWNFYLALDKDGDDRVSYTEYVNFLQQSGYGWIRPNFFLDLDRNGDGTLDFWEAITLYYVVKTRNVWCKGCQACLVGLYFTCVTCFDSASRSFDLCPTCYKRKRFNHHHSYFLDNHVLLRSKRGLPPGASNVNLALAPQAMYSSPSLKNENGLFEAFQALESGLTVGKSPSCSIM